VDDYVLVAKDKHGYNVEQVRVCNLILKIFEKLLHSSAGPKGPPRGAPYSCFE